MKTGRNPPAEGVQACRTAATSRHQRLENPRLSTESRGRKMTQFSSLLLWSVRALRGHFRAHLSPSSHYRSNSPSVMFTRAGYAPFASAVTRLPSLLASVGPARRTLSSPSINALFNPTDEHLAMRATLRTFVEREVRN